ncbi:glycosyltransferase [Paraburkholderia diazotrophica]|uniref:glycosyltransferase n=1 Tax=Paraburkholderia diazotrophica TaxID=667676 RepID=UPI0031731076
MLIPYYNAGDALVEAIQSIDYDPIRPDVIVVDDGSMKLRAKEALRSYAGPLTVKLLELPNNVGIENALNVGLSEHGREYQYIARLDCGDVCINSRIARQVQLLEANPNIHLVGSWVEFINLENVTQFELRHPSRFDIIQKRMFLNPTFTHPSVMFRSSVLDTVGLYPTEFKAAEDYAYFFNIIAKHEATNIEESLVRCLIDPHGISTQKRKRQIVSRIRIILANFHLDAWAVYGLVRSLILLMAPRELTVVLNSLRGRFMHKAQAMME